jgi:hypothetical protein
MDKIDKYLNEGDYDYEIMLGGLAMGLKDDAIRFVNAVGTKKKAVAKRYIEKLRDHMEVVEKAFKEAF